MAVGLLLHPGGAHPTASELQRFEAVEAHMGTLVRITVYAPDIDTARAGIRAGFARIRSLDQTLSDYLPQSELNALAQAAVGRPVPVSADLFAVLDAAQQLAAATNGAFDITQGPVIRLWRDARASGRAPDPAALARAAARGGYRKLHLDVDARTARLDTAGMALDVGAIGKGYAASEALAAISDTGLDRALVAVSGDLAFSAAPPGRAGWRIGIHDLPPGHTSVPQQLELTHAAVSTSGNAAQHVDIDGQRYSHVIDPVTRTGLRDDITVTVVARHGLDADGLDTAVSILGAANGLALIEAHADAAALVIERTAADVRVRASSRLQALAARVPPSDARGRGAVHPLVEQR